MSNLIKSLWSLFLFTFPLSIRWVLYEPASYRFGNFNPWVTGFVYAPEILLGLIFILWLIDRFQIADFRLEFKSKWLWTLFFLFAINAFVITYLNGDAVLGALFVLRLFEGLIVFWLITDEVLPGREVVTILLLSATLQIVWGYLQWRANQSLGLTFLGESVIGPDVYGVAKNDLAGGAKQIRAYGSFLHPNIFGAYLVIIYLISLRYLKYGYKLFWLAIFVWGIYLTHSRAAMFAGLICLFAHFMFTAMKAMSFRRSIALLLILLLGIGNLWFFKNSHAVTMRDSALQERLFQNVVSERMWQEKPLGVGARNFTLEMEHYTADKLSPWDFQPVHNTYFLILNEVGTQGLVLLILFFFLLFYRCWEAGKAVPVLALLLLMPFDHYLWDSWIGIMLAALAAGFFVKENHKEGVIEHLVHAVTHHDDR